MMHINYSEHLEFFRSARPLAINTSQRAHLAEDCQDVSDSEWDAHCPNCRSPLKSLVELSKKGFKPTCFNNVLRLKEITD
jgi:uncharacterized paraquat-inducible protein A